MRTLFVTRKTHASHVPFLFRDRAVKAMYLTVWRPIYPIQQRLHDTIPLRFVSYVRGDVGTYSTKTRRRFWPQRHVVGLNQCGDKYTRDTHFFKIMCLNTNVRLKPCLKGRQPAFFPVHSDSMESIFRHGGLALRVYDYAPVPQHALVQLQA